MARDSYMFVLESEHPRPHGDISFLGTLKAYVAIRRNHYFPYKDYPADLSLSDCLVERKKPWSIDILEPLPVTAPGPERAEAYCCYLQTVKFYKRPLHSSSGGECDLWDECETRLTWDDFVQFESDLFVVGGGSVEWRKANRSRLATGTRLKVGRSRCAPRRMASTCQRSRRATAAADTRMRRASALRTAWSHDARESRSKPVRAETEGLGAQHESAVSSCEGFLKVIQAAPATWPYSHAGGS